MLRAACQEKLKAAKAATMALRSAHEPMEVDTPVKKGVATELSDDDAPLCSGKPQKRQKVDDDDKVGAGCSPNAATIQHPTAENTPPPPPRSHRTPRCQDGNCSRHHPPLAPRGASKGIPNSDSLKTEGRVDELEVVVRVCSRREGLDRCVATLGGPCRPNVVRRDLGQLGACRTASP
eukprot:5928308-Pyramimonas_sp.AAC.4